MPFRVVVSENLAELLRVLGHPARIRIVEELRVGEKNVNDLEAAIGIRHSGVSQHLALLRGRGIVTERRDGRHVLYRLRRPGIATWLAEAMVFLERDDSETIALNEALKQTRLAWQADEPDQTPKRARRAARR